MELMARAWADGLDFVGTEFHRPANKKAGRRGFGDMICEVSNLCQAPYFAEGGTILVPHLHKGFKAFTALLPVDISHWEWKANASQFNKLVAQTKNWDSQNKLRTILHCHSIYDEYVRLDSNKFEECEKLVDTNTEYVTIQRTPFAQKCNYTKDHIKQIEKRYDVKLVEIGGHEKLGPAKVAYIIHKAKFHIGIDSGMTHFALTIKDKQDVHIYVPERKQTSPTYRWINKGYNVTLI